MSLVRFARTARKQVKITKILVKIGKTVKRYRRDHKNIGEK